MPKDMLSWDQTIFKNGEMFELDHVPEHFLHRSDQIEALTFNMRPINTLCLGPPGTGKRVLVVALDDINYLFHENEVNEVLYPLLSETRMHYVRVNSVFLPQEICFPPYARAGLNAERRASKQISMEDVDGAYESSKLVHLAHSIRLLRTLLKLIAENGVIRAGELYKKFQEDTRLGYTRYHDMLNKLGVYRF